MDYEVVPIRERSPAWPPPTEDCELMSNSELPLHHLWYLVSRTLYVKA